MEERVDIEKIKSNFLRIGAMPYETDIFRLILGPENPDETIHDIDFRAWDRYYELISLAEKPYDTLSEPEKGTIVFLFKDVKKRCAPLHISTEILDWVYNLPNEYLVQIENQIKLYLKIKKELLSQYGEN